MIERLTPLTRCTDENIELVADFFLADIFIELLRAQGALDGFLLR